MQKFFNSKLKLLNEKILSKVFTSNSNAVALLILVHTDKSLSGN